MTALLLWLLPLLVFGLAGAWGAKIGAWVVALMYVAVIAIMSVVSYQTGAPQRRIAALTSAEAYAVSLAIVWLGLVCWRTERWPTAQARLGALIAWVLAGPAFIASGLALLCANGGGCL